MSVQVKICGLKDADMVQAAIDAGASYVGFVFFEKSPRHLDVATAMRLSAQARQAGVWTVALVVDADNGFLDDMVNMVHPDILQLHGSESPERVRELAARHHRPVMKALPIEGAHDFAQVGVYEDAADLLLFDAKPPKSMENALPGGNGLSFDWRLLQDNLPRKPWMLSGGLTPENVGEAVRISGASMVDVSSGVESAPGEKDADLIRAFIAAATGE